MTYQDYLNNNIRDLMITSNKMVVEGTDKYPELTAIAKKLSESVARQINDLTKDVKSEMPYKAKYVLEEVIKLLEEKV